MKCYPSLSARQRRLSGGFVRTPLIDKQIAGQAKASGISEAEVMVTCPCFSDQS
jgi:hypothetical protein